MQDNTTREFSSWVTTILHGLVLEQAAFHTQTIYNLCHRVDKILARPYLEYLSPPIVPFV
jgi:hypothetical protein